MGYDVIVIGGGAVGMYTAFYCGLRKMKTLLCESMGELGGQLTAIYPDKTIYDVAGFPEILAKDLVHNLEKQLATVEQFVDIRLNTQVTGLTKIKELDFVIQLNEESVNTKAVIIAAGVGAFEPRPLGLDNEQAAKNIHYKVSNLEVFSNRTVAIFGGGDSAVDWANMLSSIAKDVSIVHRRDDFRAKPHFVDLLETNQVNVLKPYIAQSLELDASSKITSITIKNTQNDELYDVVADDYLINFGFTASIGAIEHFGVVLNNNKVVVNQKGETSVSGIYGCGDICTYDGRTVQIVTGFGEAINTSSAVKLYVDPASKVLPYR